MAEVRWTTQAIGDIDGIAEYIAKGSEKYAGIQIQIFFERVLILENYPRTGRIVPEFGKSSIRELLIGNYRVVYRIISFEQIDIIAVHHSARLLKKSILYRQK